MTNSERATKIRTLMAEQDMTKARLRRKTTLHINTINKLLSAEGSPNVTTLQQVASALDVSPKALI